MTQAREQGFTDVLGSDLLVQLIANGGVEDIGAEIGEQLRVTITYENSGEVPIENVNLLLDFQSELPLPISWDGAELDGGLITAEGISWSSNADEDDILEPGKRRLLNLLFPIGTVGSGQTDSFNLVASASHGNIEVRSSPINVTINSEAELTASARYFTDDGAPLGNGALPPEVDKQTTYRVYWKITNSLHDLEDVTVSATLPPNVSWEAKPAAELGSITFDSSTNTVSWSITNLPTTIDKLQANFSVSIIPEEDQIGQFVKLTSESILKATDFVTEAPLEATADGLTSELIGDEFAENKGVVIANTDPPEEEEEIIE